MTAQAVGCLACGAFAPGGGCCGACHAEYENLGYNYEVSKEVREERARALDGFTEADCIAIERKVEETLAPYESDDGCQFCDSPDWSGHEGGMRVCQHCRDVGAGRPYKEPLWLRALKRLMGWRTA